MPELHGPALLATVTTLTSLGFLMIGYDNGLLGGLGMFFGFRAMLKGMMFWGVGGGTCEKLMGE